MKKFFCIIIAIIITSISVVSCYATTNKTDIITNTIISGNTTIYKSEYPHDDIVIYETDHSDGMWHIRVIYDNRNGTITKERYKYGVLDSTRTFLNPWHHPEVYATSEIDHIEKMEDGILEDSESWFGYSYYMNPESAIDDFYWRLYDPNMTPKKKYFFTIYGDNNHTNAKQFLYCVEDMITADRCLTATYINTFKNIVLAGFSVAEAATCGRFDDIKDEISTLVGDLAESYSDEIYYNAVIYNKAVEADMYFYDIEDDIVENKKIK